MISQLGLRRWRPATLRAVGALAVVLSAVLAWAVFVAGAPVPALGVVAALTIAGVILVRPVAGVYITLIGVLTIEQYSFNPAFHPWTAKIPLYDYVFGRSIQVTPLDLLLGLTVAATAIQWLRAPKGPQGSRRPKGFTLGLAVLGVALAYAEVRGAARSSCQFYSPVGGLSAGCDYRFKVTIYELRAFIYLGATALLAVRLIDTPKRVRIVLRLFTIGVAIKVVQTLYRQFLGMSHGFTEDQMRAPTAHEDALFFAVAMVMILIALAYRSRGALERQFIALAPVLLAAFLIANRRAAYIGLVLTVPVLVAVIPNVPRRRLVMILMPMLLLFAVYTPLFWNKGGTQGRPAHAVKAIIQPSGTDAASNQYRIWEAYDLEITLRPVLFLGQGLGHKYLQPLPLPLLDSQYQPYIAHQELLWFWVATGTVGFIALWVCFGGLFITAGSALRRALDPSQAMVAGMAIAAVVMQIAASSVDLQLTFHRNMTVVGLLVGAATAVHRLNPRPPGVHVTNAARLITVRQSPESLSRVLTPVG